MQALRIPSLILAAALQVMPFARIAATVQQSASPILAIILRWGAAAAAAFGSIEAVSGASTKITSSLSAKGTNGIPFSLRLTTAPDQAHYWTASGLPSGLSLQGTSGQTFWQIAGTPTSVGTFNVFLTAKDQSNSKADRTVSSTLALTIVSQGTPPSITSQPQSQSVVAGSTVSFSVSASGTAPLSYQWSRNGTGISGATSSTLTLNSVTTGQAGTYTVQVSNSSGSITSSAATLTVTNPVIAPSITSQPQSQSVNTGSSVTFSVSANGTAPLSYQWLFNGNPVQGATSATLSLSNVQPGQSGSYAVQVSNSAGTATSSTASLTVTTPAVAPTITSQPQSQSVNTGTNVTFSVSANGTPPLNYQWFFNGNPLPGAASETLALSNVQENLSGPYTVQIGNSAGSVTSSTATLTVTTPAVAPAITSHPQSQSANVGATVTFSVGVSGTAPFSYQWSFNGSPVQGATKATLTLSNVQEGQSGQYAAQVSNSAGSVTSATATLSVGSFKVNSISSVADGVVLAWEGLAGKAYEIHASSSLAENVWVKVIGAPPATANGPMSVLIPTSPDVSSRFYRVVVLDNP